MLTSSSVCHPLLRPPFDVTVQNIECSISRDRFVSTFFSHRPVQLQVIEDYLWVSDTCRGVQRVQTQFFRPPVKQSGKTRLRGIEPSILAAQGCELQAHLNVVSRADDQRTYSQAALPELNTRLTASQTLVLSANTNEQSNIGVANRGVAGDMIKRITDLISQRGVIMSQSESAELQVDRYKQDLAALEERMQALLDRYTKQFAVMESLVGQMTSLREGLKGTFENLSAMYSNK